MAGCYEYYADLAEKLDGEQDTPIEVPMEEFKTVLRREPLGARRPHLSMELCVLQRH